MAFSEADKISIQILNQIKQYGAKQVLKELPENEWSLVGFKNL